MVEACLASAKPLVQMPVPPSLQKKKLRWKINANKVRGMGLAAI
jgi:hypothetical protein